MGPLMVGPSASGLRLKLVNAATSDSLRVRLINDACIQVKRSGPGCCLLAENIHARNISAGNRPHHARNISAGNRAHHARNILGGNRAQTGRCRSREVPVTVPH